jgi:SAM-dependent methyltransferase
MLDVARARAAELGLDDVEFAELDAEWIDLPTASQDAVLCRWGYMLVTDPAAALRETRRVLRPGGRVALAAWAGPERNPWAWRAQDVPYEQGLVAERTPSGPWMFTWSDPATIEGALHDAGFADVRVETVSFESAYASLEDWWEWTRDIAAAFRDLTDGLNERQAAALRDGLAEAFGPWADGTGGYRFPSTTNVACAEA